VTTDPGHTAQNPADNAAEAKSFQLALPVKYAYYDIAFHVVSLLIVILFYWQVVPHSGFISWLLVLTSILTLRAYANRCWLASGSHLTRHWRNRLSISAGINGILWGVAGYWCSAMLTDMHQIPAILIIAALTASSLVSLTHYWPAFMAFTITSLMPVCIGQLLFNAAMPLAAATATLLYFVIILLLGRNIQLATSRSTQLQRNNEKLFADLRQQRAEAESAQSTAEAANVSKSRFLAAASHDLRQPLHAMGLLLHALEDRLQDQEALAMVQQLENSHQSMEKLFSALLDVSRLDAGVVEVNRHVFAVEQLLEDLEQELLPLAQSRGLALDRSCPPALVQSDPILLNRILRNLINNAIVHTSTGVVSIGGSLRPKAIEISISDTGPGIPQGELGNIFSEFHQLQNPERDPDNGLGLGLAIVKRLCALLGHDLHLESTQGKGTKFSLVVERVTETTVSVYALNPHIPMHPGQLAGRSVLVIDDDARITAAMKELLTRWGLTVKTAWNLEQALLVVSSGFVPDLAICDYRLRESLTGVDVLRQINNLMGQNIPALLITGDTAPERLKDAHISGYTLMHKPVNPAKLRNAIAQQLSKPRPGYGNRDNA
jgi:signal transduction histidine kinase/ActR/RegA family two-component response regulator